MKRREAIAHVSQSISAVLPIIKQRNDSTSSLIVGVEIERIPCLQLELVVRIGDFLPAGAADRVTEQLDVFSRIAGLASERVALFVDPPGQPKPALSSPLMLRDRSGFQWNGSSDSLLSELCDASRSRWFDWLARFHSQFTLDPAAWARGATRLAQRHDVLKLFASREDAPHEAVPEISKFPPTLTTNPVRMVHAIVGFAPFLERMISGISPPTLALISEASSKIRSHRDSRS
jgi:hypothetical protein